ncbi:hypothetical protein NSU_3134 [Novosphingobium pentaromativorans US6-1]|uniref:Major facilitator superfamily (MFS) profile domain-containing protein n=2 Tax=Novosphingobium pentaromativorans TaxID=205844 RepID=G6EFL3_9SPHN|nr:hypothetical protein NSU_3134 [Novosphingobium pentaromativorans US6-1]
MSAIVLVPIVPQLFQQFAGVKDANFWIPALVAVPGLCTALLSPLAGYLGDKIGLRWPIVISLCLFSLFGAMPLILNDFGTILASRIALGVSQVVALVLSIALIGQLYQGAPRDKWLAIQTVAATSSSLVVLPLSGFMAGTALGWHGSFLLFLSGLALAAAVAWHTRGIKTTAHTAASHTDAQTPWAWLLCYCVLTLVVGVFFFTTQFQFGLALSTAGAKDSGQIGLLSAIAAVGIMLGSALFVQMKQLLGRLLLPCELLLCGITLTLMPQFPAIAPLVVLAFFNLMACGMMLPTLVTAVAERMPDEVRGRGLGLWNSSFTFGQFLSAAVVGMLLNRAGTSILDAFAVLGIVALTMSAIGMGSVLLRRSAKSETRAHPVKQ